MIDPISIIGTAGAVANIIDVVAQTIKTVRQLRNEWNEADLTLLSLTSQLAALRAALVKIESWSTAVKDEDVHHEMFIDLDASVSCCQLLTNKIEAVVSKLNRTPGDTSLRFSDKIRLVCGNNALDGVQKMIANQTSSLTLVLTAINCESVAEQRTLLQKQSSQKLFRKVKKDSISLIPLRDADSLQSAGTDNISKLSLVFDFDKVLFKSKIYEQAIRTSMKALLRKQQSSNVPTIESWEGIQINVSCETTVHSEKAFPQEMLSYYPETGQRKWIWDKAPAVRRWMNKPFSESVKQPLIAHNADHKTAIASPKAAKRDTGNVDPECNMVLFGISSSGKTTVAKQFQIIYQNGFSNREIRHWRTTIQCNLLESAQKVIVEMPGSYNFQAKTSVLLHASEEINDAYQYLLNRSVDEIDDVHPLDKQAGDAITCIWHFACVTGLSERTQGLNTWQRYFIEQAYHITSESYVPTIEDILRCPITTTGITELSAKIGIRLWRLYDVGGASCEMKKWSALFDRATAIWYMVGPADDHEVSLLVFGNLIVSGRLSHAQFHVQFPSKLSAQCLQLSYTKKWQSIRSDDLFLHTADATDTEAIRRIFQDIDRCLTIARPTQRQPLDKSTSLATIVEDDY